MALNSTFTQVLNVDLTLFTVIVGHATFCIVVVYNNAVARLQTHGHVARGGVPGPGRRRLADLPQRHAAVAALGARGGRAAGVRAVVRRDHRDHVHRGLGADAADLDLQQLLAAQPAADRERGGPDADRDLDHPGVPGQQADPGPGRHRAAEPRRPPRSRARAPAGGPTAASPDSTAPTSGCGPAASRITSSYSVSRAASRVGLEIPARPGGWRLPRPSIAFEPLEGPARRRRCLPDGAREARRPSSTSCGPRRAGHRACRPAAGSAPRRPRQR